MAERYYWLKLKRDFFKRHDVQIVEAMPNGKDYVLFYMKLLCESIDHEGMLRFSDTLPYNNDMLATITNTNIDIVRSAVKIFSQLGLMEIMEDGTYYMSEVQKMIGSSANNANAIRQQRYRDNHKIQPALPEISESVTESNATVTDGVTKSKSKSKSENKSVFNTGARTQEESEEHEVPTRGVPTQSTRDRADSFMVRFNGIPGVKECVKLTCQREMAVDNIFREFSQDNIDTVFRKIEESEYLTGRSASNGHLFRIYFDWLLDKEHFLKILEGVYDNNGDVKTGRTVVSNDAFDGQQGGEVVW